MHMIELAFEHHVDLRIFKLIYDNAKSKLSKLFKNPYHFNSCFHENKIKILEFIV